MARNNGINSTALLLDQWLETQPDGTLILPAQVPILAPAKTVNNLLANATKSGQLRRVAPGIYQKPKDSKLLGPLRPSMEEVAQAIAQRDGARIIPTGALALNILGLSTQVPMRTVYLTDGSPRVVKVGKNEIRFRRATLKLLSVKGKLSLLAMLAMKELGLEEMTDKHARNTIIRALLQEDETTLRHDAFLAPRWMQTVFHEAIKQKMAIGK